MENTLTQKERKNNVNFIVFDEDEEVSNFEHKCRLFFENKLTYDDLIKFYPSYKDIMIEKIFNSLMRLLYSKK